MCFSIAATIDTKTQMFEYTYESKEVVGRTFVNLRLHSLQIHVLSSTLLFLRNHLRFMISHAALYVALHFEKMIRFCMCAEGEIAIFELGLFIESL